MKLRIERVDCELDVLLLKNKSDGTYSFVNLTKGHICTCRFNSESDAIEDLKNDVRVVRWKIIGGEHV